MFEAKGLTLALDIAAGVPRTVHADPLRLKQVLLNLLSNAAKYTERGGATLLELTVQDSAVGIAPEQQARLFQTFVTLHGAGADETPSSGLGLSICRRLVELMGGGIEPHSQPGAGTRVRVRVPLQQPGDAAPRGPLRREGDVRLLLSDPRRPGLTGHALAQAIRDAEAADASLGRTAIVFCSGDVPPLADAFIGKPVDLSTLAGTPCALLDPVAA